MSVWLTQEEKARKIKKIKIRKFKSGLLVFDKKITLIYVTCLFFLINLMPDRKLDNSEGCS